MKLFIHYLKKFASISMLITFVTLMLTMFAAVVYVMGGDWILDAVVYLIRISMASILLSLALLFGYVGYTFVSDKE